MRRKLAHTDTHTLTHTHTLWRDTHQHTLGFCFNSIPLPHPSPCQRRSQRLLCFPWETRMHQLLLSLVRLQVQEDLTQQSPSPLLLSEDTAFFQCSNRQSTCGSKPHSRLSFMAESNVTWDAKKDVWGRKWWKENIIHPGLLSKTSTLCCSGENNSWRSSHYY